MITLKITSGSHEAILLRIHQGQAEVDTDYTDILDCISANQIIAAGDTDSPTIIYFENAEYKIVRNAQNRLISGALNTYLLSTKQINQTPSGEPTLPRNERILRTSSGKLLINSQGRLLRTHA